ncbi:MAG: hydantoinase/oxoprolinase family protein [Gammaproteobacteria bacterium]|nr:hydantoinase/oxoprolinase family protein [Gammaproteobacteria bacterium]
MMLLGIDTGGTFTDFVLYNGHSLRIHKRLSTPQAPEQAILQGIAELGVDPQHLTVIHGSTVATNAALEGKGVRTVFITNHGLGDLLTIGRQARRELYNLQPAPQPPPVPQNLCLETGGRLGADGSIVEALTAEDLILLQQQLATLQPEAVAINLLFSFLNDRFERQIEAIISAHIFTSRSSAILPEYKEYERGIATWLNAWIGPLVQRYLDRLQTGLPNTKISVMQSSGGTLAANQAARLAVNMLLSGPAGGLAGARFIGSQTQCPRLLTFDMGGTSTDVALIDGEPQLTSEGRIGPYPVAVPMVDMHTLGAGGGSYAYLDAGGLLQVGPESAGADPGPACYGRGGTRPTVTDANLILGRLRPDAFLGGQMKLDRDAARTAIASIAKPLGLSIDETALGIIRIANEHMAQALRLISVQRGIDPRQLTLMPFGGAGGLHVCALAESLGMHQALVPIHSGVLSAFGMLVSPRSRELSRSIITPLTEISTQTLESSFTQLESQGQRALIDEGAAATEIACKRSLDLRYQGQAYHLNIPWQELMSAVDAFHEVHHKRYGHRLNNTVELVNIRTRLAAPRPELKLPLRVFAQTSPTPVHDQSGTTIWQRDQLNPRQSIAGPALITDDIATTFIANGWHSEMDDYGNLLLTRVHKT